MFFEVSFAKAGVSPSRVNRNVMCVWKKGQRVSLAGKSPTSQRKGGRQGVGGSRLPSPQAGTYCGDQPQICKHCPGVVGNSEEDRMFWAVVRRTGHTLSSKCTSSG